MYLLNEKRGREIDEIPKIDSAMAKPKEKAKATRQVTEFKDTYRIVERFYKEMIFEMEDFDPLKDYFESDDDEAEEMKDAPYDRDAVLKYIKQVRDSFGFDVDVYLPRWLAELRYFVPFNMSYPSNRAYAYEAANFAIDEINADMNSKSYELVEVVKCVMAIPNYFLGFFTLTAKKVGEAEAEAAVVTIQAIVENPIRGPSELDQWRFKPDAPTPAEEA